MGESVQLVLLALTTASCADREATKPSARAANDKSGVEGPKEESVLSGDDLEAVELAVAMLVRQNAMNPVEVPKRIESLSAKYAKARFNASTKGCMVVPDGTTTFGEISFTLTGDREIAMAFTDGAIGFREDDIWVREGTNLQLNDKKYTYQRGKWRAVK
ncbi:MAG: hypothetical protein FJ276_14265 [Planctomycetes bacterium]|nr:hypothetical protein [Planctomycetota bacterium]